LKEIKKNVKKKKKKKKKWRKDQKFLNVKERMKEKQIYSLNGWVVSILHYGAGSRKKLKKERKNERKKGKKKCDKGRSDGRD